MVGDEHLGAFCYCGQHLRAHATGWCTVSLRDKKALAAKTIEDAGIECMVLGYELDRMERVPILPRDVQPLWTRPTFVECRDPYDGSKSTFSKVMEVSKVRDAIHGTRYLVKHEGAYGSKTFLVTPRYKLLVYRYRSYT